MRVWDDLPLADMVFPDGSRPAGSRRVADDALARVAAFLSVERPLLEARAPAEGEDVSEFDDAAAAAAAAASSRRSLLLRVLCPRGVVGGVWSFIT